MAKVLFFISKKTYLKLLSDKCPPPIQTETEGPATVFPTLGIDHNNIFKWISVSSIPDSSVFVQNTHNGDSGVGTFYPSAVAHGKVCLGARTLSVWVKASCTLGLGPAEAPCCLVFGWQSQTPMEFQSPLPLTMLWFNQTPSNVLKWNQRWCSLNLSKKQILFWLDGSTRSLVAL